MPKSPKRLKAGDPGYRHPYMEYENTQLWSWVWKAVRDLVKNKDLIETEDPHYTVGYICKVISNGQKRVKTQRKSPR
jgi:hypothetical protein